MLTIGYEITINFIAKNEIKHKILIYLIYLVFQIVKKIFLDSILLFARYVKASIVSIACHSLFRLPINILYYRINVFQNKISPFSFFSLFFLSLIIPIPTKFVIKCKDKNSREIPIIRMVQICTLLTVSFENETFVRFEQQKVWSLSMQSRRRSLDHYDDRFEGVQAVLQQIASFMKWNYFPGNEVKRGGQEKGRKPF